MVKVLGYLAGLAERLISSLFCSITIINYKYLFNIFIVVVVVVVVLAAAVAAVIVVVVMVIKIYY